MRKTAAFRWMSCLPLVAAIALPVAEGRVDCTCHVRDQRRTVVHISCPDVQNGSAVDSCVTAKQPSGRAARRYVGDGFQFLSPRSLVRFSRAYQPWRRAREACQLHGADLFVPLDEQSVRPLTASPFRELYREPYFIGLNDLQSEGIFVDVQGHPAHYLNWSSDEPNNALGSEHCVTLDARGQMNDLSCDQEAPFLCERRLRGPPPEGYAWSAAAGAFLRLSGHPQPGPRAAADCAANGAALFLPDTAARVEALLRAVPVDIGDLLVGLSDAQTEGVFVSDAGEPLSDMEFSGWLPGQPDDGAASPGAPGEDCVSLHSHGFLADVSCHQPRRYVCEWRPGQGLRQNRANTSHPHSPRRQLFP